MAFSTSKSMLSKIKAGDNIAWSDFYRTYRPLIMLCGSDCNLSASEKEELMQDTVLSMFKGQHFVYDRSKGRFRDYLRRIIKRRAYDIIRKRSKHQELDENILNSLESPEQDDRWAKEWRQHVLNEALRELRSAVEPSTFQAFDLFVIRDMKASKVAEVLDISENTVYLAKMRSLKKLKEIVKNIDE